MIFFSLLVLSIYRISPSSWTYITQPKNKNFLVCIGNLCNLGPDHVQVSWKHKCFGNISQLETRPLIGWPARSTNQNTCTWSGPKIRNLAFGYLIHHYLQYIVSWQPEMQDFFCIFLCNFCIQWPMPRSISQPNLSKKIYVLAEWSPPFWNIAL